MAWSMWAKDANGVAHAFRNREAFDNGELARCGSPVDPATRLTREEILKGFMKCSACKQGGDHDVA